YCLIVTDLTGQKRQEAMAEEARRKDEFLAMLGHELRNPLAAIRNAVEAMSGADGTGPKADRAWAAVGRQAAHLTRLVDDLLEVERDGGAAVVRVRDTGQGIPADLLPRVFDLFTQGDRPLDRSHGGLGLGLTLVRRLAELHGGTVEARSDGPGRGSEFVVRLP